MYLSLNISVIKCAVCVMFVLFVCVYISIQCDMSVCVYIYKFVVFEYVCLHW